MAVILFQENRIQIILNLNSIEELSHQVVNLGISHLLYLGRKIDPYLVSLRVGNSAMFTFLKSLETLVGPCSL